MPTQEIQTITKETLKTVLKAVCESPTLTIEELSLQLKGSLKKISQSEIVQVIHGISPNKNWHRASEEEIQKEILDYIWTLETQIFFLFPSKQKETSMSDFNQTRLQNKQPKVLKEILRNLIAVLMVEGKNLSRFRKFHKELSFQNDLEINIQTMWLARIVLANINPNQVSNMQDLSSLLASEILEKSPVIAEKSGKSLQRICERFVEKYFPKKISDTRLRELIGLYQTIYNTYKQASESGELSNRTELKDQNKIMDKILERLNEVQNIVNESHEGGFISKLFSGKVKGKDGVISRINEVIALLNEINDVNSKANKSINDKSFLVQKIQSEYDNIVFVKNQLEHDLSNMNEKLQEIQEKNSGLERDFKEKSELVVKLQERIALLQQKVDEIPEIDAKVNLLRDELTSAKTISLSLYSRIQKMKDELLKQNTEIKTSKTITQNGNSVVHKFHTEQENQATEVSTN